MLRRRLDSGIPAPVDAGKTPHVVAVFLRWIWWRAVLHNGWWLVTSIYLVVDADLSPSQLVLIGVGQAIVALVFEVPAGVLADTISRKWSLVVSHLLMGTAMLATGLVTDFPSLVATQMLWGLSWTFASGADVAWITDEFDEPGRISVVLMRSGRVQLLGAAAGILGVGALAAVTQRSTAMVLAGAAMLLLGLYVALRFPEQRFIPASTRRVSASWSILVRGFRLVRRSRAILLMFAAWFLVNGAAIASGRLQARRLVDLGLPSDPVVWFTALGVLTLLVGAGALRVMERHIEGTRTALRGYAIACTAGAVGLIVLAGAPEGVSGSAAVLLVAGIALPLTRTLGTIWLNRQTSSDVRATVHSLLAQAEYTGEIACGLGVAAVARFAGLSAALLTGAALFALAVFITASVRSR
ncbi:MAG: MFS transporter [Actinomycetota bacterium]|nr:MFS transporter [Actinomycetota bacterium]